MWNAAIVFLTGTTQQAHGMYRRSYALLQAIETRVIEPAMTSPKSTTSTVFQALSTACSAPRSTASTAARRQATRISVRRSIRNERTYSASSFGVNRRFGASRCSSAA